MERIREQVKLGAMLEPEARLLQALIQVTLPETIVEFGYHGGYSSGKMLEALDYPAMIYSYDVKRPSPALIRSDKRLKIHWKDMKTFSSEDVDGREVDLVFFDASHDYEDNMVAWKALEPCLADDAYLVIHDTGYWITENFDYPLGEDEDGKRYHCPDERRWVTWLEGEGWNAVTFFTDKRVRHGITVLQRKKWTLPGREA